MDDSATSQQKSLAAICAKAFSMIITLSRGHNLGDATGLRSRVTATFGALEKQALECGYVTEDVRLARYALTAFVDEAISRTDWAGKHEWSKNPLSLEYFGDNVAGDEFFNRLAELRQQIEGQYELLEVYYTCLALGFEGKYALSDPHERRTLVDQIGRDLERLRPGAAELSPNWRPPEALSQLVAGDVPLGVITAIAAGLVFALFIVLNVLLNGQAGDVAEAIKQLGSAAP